MRGSGCARLSSGDANVRSGSYSTSISATASAAVDLVARDDRRHRIADEADDVRTERVLVVTDGQDAVRNRQRRAGQHQVHARMRRRLRGVDPDDARVRMRRAQQPPVQHPRQDDVVGEPRLAGDLRAAVHAPAGLADDVRSSLQTAEQGSEDRLRTHEHGCQFPALHAHQARHAGFGPPRCAPTASMICGYPVHRHRLPDSASRMRSRDGWARGRAARWPS